MALIEIVLKCPNCGAVHSCVTKFGECKHHRCKNCLQAFAEPGHGDLNFREREVSGSS